MVDIFSWYAYKTSSQRLIDSIIEWLYEIYPMAEAIFFFWAIGYFSAQMKIKKITRMLTYGVFPAWLLIEVWLGSIEYLGIAELGLYHMLYRVICSFLASYALLLLLEEYDQVFIQPKFWFLAGILWYCFTTFFVLLIRGTIIASKLWYLHNSMNIMTYVLYSIGFYIIVSKASRKELIS